jgi:hypothetical protein
MASPYYVRSGAGGAGTGADWANAYTTLAAAFSGKAAGDTFYVAHDHAETQTSAMTLTSPGTAAAPCIVLCTDDANTPPVAGDLRTTGTISVTNSGINMTFGGYAYVYGITFQTGNSTNNSAMNINGVALGWIFDTCGLSNLGNGSGGLINLNSGSSGKDEYVELINSTITFSNASQKITLGNGRFRWSGGSYSGAVQPTNLLLPTQGMPCDVIVSGVDLSALGSGKNLVSSAILCSGVIKFQNCKLNASLAAVKNGTIGGQGALTIDLDNCDSGDTITRRENYTYQGAVVNNTANYNNAGSTDGTTHFSRAMTSLSNAEFASPLRSPWMYQWRDSTAATTATVEIMHDSLTALKDNEVWVEVEYLGTSGFPLDVQISDRATDILATAANQTASGATWTTSGITNVNTQKLVTGSFAAAHVGYVRARVVLAKATYTVYYDQKITFS